MRCATVLLVPALRSRKNGQSHWTAQYILRPALSGDVLTATVKERKRGQTISVFLVEIWNDKAKHIADATFTMYYTKEA